MKLLPLLALVLIPSLALSQGLFSSDEKSEKPEVEGTLTQRTPNYTREMVLGNILKGALENMHLANKSIDDTLSKEAFKLYLERIDYGKQFLTEGDVKALSKYDDQKVQVKPKRVPAKKPPPPAPPLFPCWLVDEPD